MSAVDTVENLIKLGTIISDAAQKSGTGKTDWATFLASPAFQNIAGSVSQLLSTLKPSDLPQTVQALNDKQTALLGGKTLADLPTDKLLQYAELGNVKVVLAAQLVVSAMNPPFATWLVDSALPVLVKAAPVVLPLLL